MSDHRGVELRHLRYFVTVAEEGTMTEAARVLRITQPSLSQQISALERRVGASLFHRRPTGMELTEGGRILYASAGRVLAELESSLVRARDARRPVRVGVSGSVPEHLLARAEQIFGDDGSLDVEFAEADSQEQLDLLRTGALAFGVMRVFHAIEGLATLTLAGEPLGVLLRCDHPLADHAVLSWADLAGQELLWFPARRNPRFAEYVLTHLAGHGWSPRLHVVDAQSKAMYRHRLRTSENLVTLRARNGNTADAGLAWRPLACDPPRQRFVLATLDDSPLAGLLAHTGSRSSDYASVDLGAAPPPSGLHSRSSCASESETSRLAKEISGNDLTNHQDLFPRSRPTEPSTSTDPRRAHPALSTSPRIADRSPAGPATFRPVNRATEQLTHHSQALHYLLPPAPGEQGDAGPKT